MTSNLISPESSEKTEVSDLFNFSRIIDNVEVANFNLIRFIVHPGKESVQDQHKVQEYWYIAKGKGLLVINDKETVANEGNLFYFKSFDTHRIKNLSLDSDIEILSIWW